MVALKAQPITASAESDGEGTRITFSDGLGDHVTYTERPLTQAQRREVVHRLKATACRLDAVWALDKYLRECGYESSGGVSGKRVERKPPIGWVMPSRRRAA
jgi:hypothetical protein